VNSDDEGEILLLELSLVASDKSACTDVTYLPCALLCISHRYSYLLWGCFVVVMLLKVVHVFGTK
jgi:hypothetical protein